jgi:hypothetical protein
MPRKYSEELILWILAADWHRSDLAVVAPKAKDRLTTPCSFELWDAISGSRLISLERTVPSAAYGGGMLVLSSSFPNT